jgi:hypothetical protein
MKISVENRKSLLGPELYGAIAEICSDDPVAFEEMITEAVNALSEIEYLELNSEECSSYSAWPENDATISY